MTKKIGIVLILVSSIVLLLFAGFHILFVSLKTNRTNYQNFVYIGLIALLIIGYAIHSGQKMNTMLIRALKILIRMLIIMICWIAFVYFFQALKANRVSEIRIKMRLEQGEISVTEYENFKRQNTLLKTLLNPKEVASVD